MTERSDLAELAKRRGFFFPSNDAYGGTAGLYTYGPEGAALKRNIEAVWRDQFVRAAGHMELESPTVVPEAVFEASGHLETFDDMIVECADCGATHRADHLVEDAVPDVDDAEAFAPRRVADLVTVSGRTTAREAAQAFISNDIEQAPLVSGDELAGILRDVDLLEALV